MDTFQQAIQMLQGYQAETARLQQFLSGAGKAPQPETATPEPETPPLGAEPVQLTSEQHKLLNAIVTSFLRGEQDGSKELVTGLTKLGRYAQSEFDKLKAK